METVDTGIFWLELDGQSDARAHVEGVPGTLTIDQEGEIKLDLIGTFPGRTGWDGVFGVQVAGDAAIYGRLKNKGNHVLLRGISPRGGKGGHGLEYEVFLAKYALVSPKPFSQSMCVELHMPLLGHEAWSCPGVQSSEMLEGNLHLNMCPSSKRVYSTNLGKLSYESCISFQGAQVRHSASVALAASLTLELHSPSDVDEVHSVYRAFQDLVLILSNLSEFTAWPIVKLSETAADATLFFKRYGGVKKSNETYSVWVSFDDVADDFGKIVDKYFEQKALLGPGLHLYLGTKRSMPLYIEHKFVNMAWGLEALHRRVHGVQFASNPRLLEKVERVRRVLDTASWHSRSDKNWIVSKLKNAGEPSLAERIEHLFSGLGLEVDASALKTFSARCAALRNDLSHYGGERDPGTYALGLEEYARYGQALDHLYHLLLLARIGVSAVLLRQIVERPLLFVRQGLEEVGLVPNKP